MIQAVVCRLLTAPRAKPRRRRTHRPAQRRLDQLFAATLINQIRPGPTATGGVYAARTVRLGIIVDIRV